MLLLSAVMSSSSAADTIDNKIMSDTQRVSITQLGIIDSEKGIRKLVDVLKNEDIENFQNECDDKYIALSCYYYASYQGLVLENNKKSYLYHKKAFDLGIKQAGYFVGYFQLKYPEIVFEEETADIDKSIYYLEQAFDAGSADATRMLMVVYRDPELNHVDYIKAEYYNQIAIKQNVRKSRFTLAYLYLEYMKDVSKIEKSIQLLKDDLSTEANWESALMLSSIYLKFDAEGEDLESSIIQAVAYAYLSRKLRENIDTEGFNNVDNRFVEAMEKELSPRLIKQSRAIYLEMLAEINESNVT